ncbi:hypothetical protein GCM10007304_42450 [Rhodococcoides trifolii]|uniref:Tetracyclin repressor-like C-terminal group 31 domain-containing protein n=1 Tax=Rhodococcoides trifolii TaxID=908250 RepID=A0A917G5N3_9NOCA|nr:TetR/AcrR family transcriptional regulator [Rhodococcus trifolii]GGG24120.1 hypothetical protein GCM10007304_42450 [Rhodococcus trifolii]
MTAARSTTTDRRALMADGAIELLAAGGVHGLTHRRLDRALGLPEGSASNVFARRIDLLRAALDVIVAREMAIVQSVSVRDDVMSIDAAADVFADVMDAWLRPANREVLIARYTLILEASRSGELAPLMAAARSRFVELAENVCSATSMAADRTDAAVQIVAWADGVLLAHITAAERVPSRADIRSGVRLLLTG